MTTKNFMWIAAAGIAAIAGGTFVYLKAQEKKNLAYATIIAEQGVEFSEPAEFDTPPLPADIEDYENLESIQDWLAQEGIDGDLLSDFENSGYDNFDDWFYGN